MSSLKRKFSAWVPQIVAKLCTIGRMRRLWLGWACLLVIGCGSKGEDGWVTLDIAPESTPAGWQHFSRPEAGVSLDLPPNWIIDDRSLEVKDKIETAVNQVFPGFGPVVGAPTNPPGCYLTAMDIDPEDLKAGAVQTMAATVQVMDRKFEPEKFVTMAPKASLSYVETLKEPIGSVLHFTQRVDVPDLKTKGATAAIKHIFMFGREKFLWSITVMEQEGNARALPAILQLIKTVRVSKPNSEALAKVTEDEWRKGQEARDERARQESEAQTRQYEAETQRLNQEEAARRQSEQQQAPPADPQPNQSPGQGDAEGQQQPPPTQEPPPSDPPAQNPPANGDASGG